MQSYYESFHHHSISRESVILHNSRSILLTVRKQNGKGEECNFNLLIQLYKPGLANSMQRPVKRELLFDI